MIIFEKVRFKNFLSFGNNFTEINLNRKSNTLIVGKNGSGKTTSLISIVFALFGKPLKNIKKTSIVNSINKKDCLVELYFIKNNDNYIVKRGINPNIFEIWKNNELINQSSSNIDYQKVLEDEIIQSSYKTFIQTVVIQSRFVPFMELSLPERRELIEDIFNVNYFSEMNVILKNRMKNNKDNLIDKKYQIENNNNLLNKEIENNNKIKDNNDNLIKKYEDDIKLNEDSILKIDSNINKINDKIVQLKKLYKDNSQLIDGINKLKILESNFNNKLNTLNKDKSFFDKNDICPVCSQNIDHIFKNEKLEKIIIEIKNIKENIEKIKLKNTTLNNNLVKVNDYNKKIDSNILELNTKLNNILSNKNSLVNLNKKLNSSILELKNINNKNINNNNIDEINNKLKKLEQDYDNLSEEQKYLNIVGEALKDSGIKSFIIKSFLPKINNLINKYMDIFGFNCSFELNEQFEETIKARYCQKYSYGNFSEGEKLRINLSILFMFRELADLRSSLKTNILFFDEALDSSLDEDGVNGFLHIINTLEKDKDIFVISHHGESFYDNFDNIIKFEKSGNFSVKKVDTFIE